MSWITSRTRDAGKQSNGSSSDHRPPYDLRVLADKATEPDTAQNTQSGTAQARLGGSPAGARLGDDGSVRQLRAVPARGRRWRAAGVSARRGYGRPRGWSCRWIRADTRRPACHLPGGNCRPVGDYPDLRGIDQIQRAVIAASRSSSVLVYVTQVSNNLAGSTITIIHPDSTPGTPRLLCARLQQESWREDGPGEHTSPATGRTKLTRASRVSTAREF